MTPATSRHRVLMLGRLGLRSRITVTFALGALGVSVALSLITYGLTRRSVLHSHQISAIHQTAANAVVVGAALRSSSPDLPVVLSSLATPNGSTSLLYHGGNWVTTNFAAGSSVIPSSLRTLVIRRNTAATMQYRLDGHAELAVGLPVAVPRSFYFELYDFSDVSRTLAELAISLAAASAATTVAGMTLGRWASRRLLSPLAQTATAAAAIAGGRLDTRLEAGDDADLAGLADSFNSMVTALEDRIRRDARFASDVSHELRSPLTTLRTAVEVLEHRRAEMPERSAQALDLLSDEVDRFGKLVEDLLEVSRFDAGAAHLALEDVRPGELVARALDGLGYGRVELVVEPGLAGISIRADKRRLERVLANLLNNAEVHGGGAVRVTVGPLASGAAGTGATGGAGYTGMPVGVFLAVDDAGPGVPAEARRVVFERFARGRAAGRRARGEGVGLGLSLVAEHVRLHGGRVAVTDSPEGGARFVVELPVDPEGSPLPPFGHPAGAGGRGAGTEEAGSSEGNRGLPRGLGEDPRGSRPPEGAAAHSRASEVGSTAARGTTGSRAGSNLLQQ